MEGLDYWRLCDELSVVEAALLIAGCDPSGDDGCVENMARADRPRGYDAAMSALKYAVLSGSLLATIRRTTWLRGWDEEPGDGERCTNDVKVFPSDIGEEGAGDFLKSVQTKRTGSSNPALLKRHFEGVDAGTPPRGVIYRAEPDWSLTTVRVDTLREWLVERGFATGFFFPQATDTPDYLDPQHPRYSAKLAAAVHAWLAVSKSKGRSPKAVLLNWLREHCATFGLTDKNGEPNETGIEECAKVANWRPSGGAPKTPGA